MRKQFRAEIVQVWLWNRSQKEWVWGRHCKDSLNGSRQWRGGKDFQVFQAQKIITWSNHRGTIWPGAHLFTQHPHKFGPGPPESLRAFVLVTWRNFVLVRKRNQNGIPNSLLINSSAVWEMPTFPHPMTVRLELKCCSCPLTTLAHIQAVTFTEQVWWILPGLLDQRGLWTQLCF